jgi:hypothetical protein
MRVKLEKKKLWLKDEIESHKNLNKKAKEEEKKWGSKWKTKHMINCNWKTKLKKKNLYKEIRMK